MKNWMVVIAMGLLAAIIITASGITFLSTVGTQRITLFSSRSVNCENPETTFLILRIPDQARLFVDTDPSAPYWPFYYGGIKEIIINQQVVKNYQPPLLDTDDIDVKQYLNLGFNTFKLSINHAPVICNIQTQATVNAYIDVVYIDDDDGGNGGNGGGLQNIFLLFIGLGFVGLATYIMVKKK